LSFRKLDLFQNKASRPECEGFRALQGATRATRPRPRALFGKSAAKTFQQKKELRLSAKDGSKV
ncbi:MAG: hypothetical protein SO125_06685, partial [Eubacteriales bacterium]|nr:hypothetical protein [Eubacteriales bacterium]